MHAVLEQKLARGPAPARPLLSLNDHRIDNAPDVISDKVVAKLHLSRFAVDKNGAEMERGRPVVIIWIMEHSLFQSQLEPFRVTCAVVCGLDDVTDIIVLFVPRTL